MKNILSNVLMFLKRNIIYVILTCCILAVGLSITLVLVTGDQVKTPVDSTVNGGENGEGDKPVGPTEPDTPVGPSTDVVTFILPVANATSIAEYSLELSYNATLGRYEVHDAIDFFAPENTSVMAVYDGTVESIVQSPITGYTVVLDHGNGLKTHYNSLSDEINLEIGQAVEQGDIIGAVATTNRQEYKDGAHLHFEVFENDKNIDPIKYLDYQK